MTLPILLASSSPRRRDLLEQVGLQFDVSHENIDERMSPGEEPAAYAVRMAEEKARSAAQHAASGIVIAADTIVVKGNAVLGKPADSADALRMLRLLSGTDHRVITGLAVLRPSLDRMLSTAVTTRVWFRSLREEEMIAYAGSDEPLDKAGGYGIQEKGCLFVDRIEGCYFNVVGLPMSVLGKLLDEQGIPLW